MTTTTFRKSAAGNLFAYDPRAGWLLVPVPLTRWQKIKRTIRRAFR